MGGPSITQPSSSKLSTNIIFINQVNFKQNRIKRKHKKLGQTIQTVRIVYLNARYTKWQRVSYLKVKWNDTDELTTFDAWWRPNLWYFYRENFRVCRSQKLMSTIAQIYRILYVIAHLFTQYFVIVFVLLFMLVPLIWWIRRSKVSLLAFVHTRE